VAEEPLVLRSAVTEALALGLLIATRNAARVALGRLHVRSAALELRLLVSLGTLPRALMRVFAIPGHRSSSSRSFPFSAAYHVTTD
jgi:hypothetical protein